MKWIRWNGRHWATRNDDGETPVHFYERDFDCEKDANWREIESGEWNPETGKLKITLKPVPTLPEAVVACLEANWGDYRRQAEDSRKKHPNSVLVQLVDALDREASTPANPYTKESVDELLDAAEKAPVDYFRESTWFGDSHKRMARALTALKEQREAANA